MTFSHSIYSYVTKRHILLSQNWSKYFLTMCLVGIFMNFFQRWNVVFFISHIVYVFIHGVFTIDEKVTALFCSGYPIKDILNYNVHIAYLDLLFPMFYLFYRLFKAKICKIAYITLLIKFIMDFDVFGWLSAFTFILFLFVFDVSFPSMSEMKIKYQKLALNLLTYCKITCVIFYSEIIFHEVFSAYLFLLNVNNIDFFRYIYGVDLFHDSSKCYHNSIIDTVSIYFAVPDILFPVFYLLYREKKQSIYKNIALVLCIKSIIQEQYF